MELKIRQVFDKATFISPNMIMDEHSTINRLSKIFSTQLCISLIFKNENKTKPEYISMRNVSFLKELKDFGSLKFSGRFFTMILFDKNDNIFDVSSGYTNIDTDSSEIYNLIVFLNSEDDKELLIKEFALIKKLSD